MTTCSRVQKTLDWYTDRFEREHRDARAEFVRLSELFKDVNWYNFETTCRAWMHPWHESDLDSPVQLHARVVTQKWARGCLFEHGRFPMYYEGPVRDAPKLPPEIVLIELRDAFDYMKACEKQMSAPYDWAPGGFLYEHLRRTTVVPTGSVCLYDSHKRKFSGSPSTDAGGADG